MILTPPWPFMAEDISVAFAGIESKYTHMSVPQSNTTTTPPAYKFL
jgi:hypothetical protein